MLAAACSSVVRWVLSSFSLISTNPGSSEGGESKSEDSTSNVVLKKSENVDCGIFEDLQPTVPAKATVNCNNKPITKVIVRLTTIESKSVAKITVRKTTHDSRKEPKLTMNTDEKDPQVPKKAVGNSEGGDVFPRSNLVRNSLRRSTSFSANNQTVSDKRCSTFTLPPRIILESNLNIEHLTESALGDIFVPWDSFRNQLVRQCRDVFVCSYFGNLSRFDHQFLKPSAELLRQLQKSSKKQLEDNVDVDCWPLTCNGHILVHLGECESGTILCPGDVFLHLSEQDSSVQLAAKFRRSNSSVAGKTIDGSHFTNVFNDMDFLASLNPDELVTKLQNLVTTVEGNIERIPWKAIVSSASPWAKSDFGAPKMALIANDFQCQNEPDKLISAANDECVEDDDGYHDGPEPSTQITSISQLEDRLIHDQSLIVPGCIDNKGRPIAILKNSSKPMTNSTVEVSKMFSYAVSMFSKELVNLGFVLVVDNRDEDEIDLSAIENLFNIFEGNIGIHSVMFFIKPSMIEEVDEKLENLSLPHYPDIQKQTVQSLDELSKIVDLSQLPESLGGSYKYCHDTWIAFKTNQEDFTSNGRRVAAKLVKLMQEIKDGILPTSVAATNKVIEDHRKLVATVLRDDPDLIKYRSDGRNLIKDLKKISAECQQNRDFSHGVKSCVKLHDKVEKITRKVAKLANKRLQCLESCLQLKSFEEESSQILNWLSKKGEESLKRLSPASEDLPNIKKQEREFEKFYFTAMRNIEKGQDLIDEAAMLQQGNYDEAISNVASSLKLQLSEFSERLECKRETYEGISKCYHLLDKSYEWAVNAMKFLSNVKMEKAIESIEEIEKFLDELQIYLQEHPPMSLEVFDEMTDLASRVNSNRLTDQIKVAKERCAETEELIRTRQVTLLKAKLQIELNSSSQCSDSLSSYSSCQSLIPKWALPYNTSTPCSQLERRSSVPSVSSHSSYCTLGSFSHSLNKRVLDYENSVSGDNLITEDLTEQGPVTSIPKTVLEARKKESDEVESDNRFSVLERKLSGGLLSNKSQRKLFKRSNTWQVDDPNFYKFDPYLLLNGGSPERRRSVESVASSLQSEDSSMTESSDTKSTVLEQQSAKNSSSTVNISPNQTLNSDNQSKNKRMLSLIMKEMIQTERDYVKSLGYIIDNYIPELLREDIPQALRGQRNVIFGNIEKIYEFHSRYFLHELEQCEPAPFLVGLCFLRYDPEFHLYALYNKNKPKCDNLMSEYGNQFFKEKQIELNDKMDLASYLLKPVQRMGKYALLLKELLKECPETDSKYQNLRAAEDMVKFQLRHGNDLLAMDALRDCDVNVKEQGRLLRQDEFLVCQGKNKKAFRRIFLFEDLILFSKARRDQENKGHEIYQYKHSIKTTDLGLTEQVDDSSVKFEIWFRKRKVNDVYLLQASSAKIRSAWVQEISKQLWKQALKNREMRLVEHSSMGIGSKPCLDIKPGKDQINDRAININFMKGSWLRRSVPQASYDNFSNSRPQSTISVNSSSSSSGSSYCSQSGTLNLAFEGADHSSRPLCRSVTQHSQCSNESGICVDISLLENCICTKTRKKAERSDSIMSSDSMMTQASGLSNPGSIGSGKVPDIDEDVTVP